MFKKSIWWAAALCLLITAGCSGETQESAESNTETKTESRFENKEEQPLQLSTDPVTVTLMRVGLNYSDESFAKFIADPVKQKYPYITVEQVPRKQIGELLAANAVPDLIYMNSPDRMPPFLDVEVISDLREVAKKHRFDFDKFDSGLMGTVRGYGAKGEIYAVPVIQDFHFLLYNKEIFDKFAVSYPVDGMDWDQTLDLAKKLTRLQDGTQYIGLGFRPSNFQDLTGGTPYADASGMPAINNSQWQQLFGLFQEFYRIPGFIKPTGKDMTEQISYVQGDFFDHRFLAMYLNQYLATLNRGEDVLKELNWDMVQVPNFKDKVGTGRNGISSAIVITSLSKVADQAMQVIEVMTSDNVQLAMSRAGQLGTLNDPRLQQVFGAEVASMQGKNLAGALKSIPAKSIIAGPYDDLIQSAIANAMQGLAFMGKDVNTSLREVEEAALKAITERKSAQ